jgi:hypothetical protein
VSSLSGRIKVRKITTEDHEGNEDEFSGEGFLFLRGDGKVISVIELHMKVNNDVR